MNLLKRFGFLIVPLGIVFLGTLGFSHRVDAAAENILTSVYQDANNNGTVDRIRWTFDTTITACVYDAADWTVNTPGSINVSITGISCTGSDAILYIAVSADANETGGATDPVISYANAGTVDSVMAGASGAGGHASQTNTDNAAPVLSAAQIFTTTCGTTDKNGFRLTYTEDIQFSTNGGSGFGTSQVASTATFGSMTTERVIAGVATFNGTSDMVQSAATSNLVASFANVLIICMNQPNSSYFSSGTIAPTTPVFTATSDVTALKDLVGLAANGSAAGVTATETTPWDVTKPTVSNTYSCDTDADGNIDTIQVNFSESLVDGALSNSYFEGDNDSTNDGVGEHAVGGIGTATGGCDGLSDDTDANDNKIRVTFGFGDGVPGTEAAFLNVNSGNIVRDSAGNTVTAGSGLGTENDKALPLLMSSSPASGAAAVSRTSSIALTFSEAVTTVSAATSPTSVTLTPTGAPGATITMTHTTAFAAGSNTLTISTAPDTSANAFGGAATSATHPFSFTVVDTGGSSYTPPPASYSLTITSPSTGDSLSFGNTKFVTWTSTGAAMTYVSLYYSTDGGATYKTIVTNTPNDGSFEWNIADINSSNTTLYITGSDLATILASDVSGIFTVHGTVTPDEVVEAPSSGKTGISPLTGQVEDISVVKAGDVIRGLGFSTVYLIDAKLVRHPFMDAQTYFTYYNEFSPVTNVTNATLPTLTLGTPVLPKAGVTLVKIQSDNRVFALALTTTGTELRWVPSEAVAKTLYGSLWADYVIDIPPTLFPKFTIGADMTETESVNRSIMKTRFALSVERPSSDDDGDGLTNEREARLGTAINDADTDNDGYADGMEVDSGHDPLTALDSDGDGYPDYIEISNGHNPYGR